MKAGDLVYVRARVVGHEYNGRVVVQWAAKDPDNWHAVVPVESLEERMEMSVEQFVKFTSSEGM